MTAVWDLPAVRAGIARQREHLAALERDGASLIGWKVGVGAPASMAAAGIPAPLVGYLTTRSVIDDGATVHVGEWTRPMLEPEIAIHLGTDVPGGASTEEAAAAIAAVGLAIELADVDVALTDLERVVAGDIFHRAVIFGPTDTSRHGGLVEDLRVRVERGSDEVAQTDDVTALTGPPAQLVAHVATWLAASGQHLRAGHIIIGGSVVPILPVEPGDSITYDCAPIGHLTVSFSG